METEEEVMLSDKLEEVDGSDSVVSVEEAVNSMELVDGAIVDCEEEALESVEAAGEDAVVCVVVETEKLRVEELLDSTEDNDSEAEKSEIVNVLELSEEPVDVDDSPELEIEPLEDVGVSDVTPDTVVLEDLEKTAPCSGSPLKDVANGEADGSVEVEVEAPSDTASNELESVNESEKLDELGDADEPEALRVSAEDETLNELDEPLEDIGVADVTSDTVVLEDLEKTAPCSGGPLKDVDNGKADGSVEVEVEASSDTASNELDSVNESEKLDELGDADEPEALGVSAEDEMLNELDKLDSAEDVEDVDRVGELVANGRLEESDDAEDDEELKDSSTLSKDCCATMIVPGRLPDGGMVEIGSGVVRTSVPEYGTVDVTKRPSRAKTIVPGAVPLGCIVVMGIVPVILLVPE
ncbi:hypothetical protein LZ31DRAFT_533750 [Colletotrichum somersetense]|nr:hypothetical protein LZ31DRAFT_533750 [Colletotrichum somersetense]